MRAVKNNKEYHIDQSQKKAYQDAGFDIYDEEGNVAAYGQGKAVSYELYEKERAEAERLRKENEELRAEMDEMLALENLPYPAGGPKWEDQMNTEDNLGGDSSAGQEMDHIAEMPEKVTEKTQTKPAEKKESRKK